jgi:hypothetical protein
MRSVSGRESFVTWHEGVVTGHDFSRAKSSKKKKEGL